MISGVDVVVHGRVQGVFFRAFTLETAQQLKLVGWVRNQSDGTVALHASGTRENLKQFLSRLEAGPMLAKVDRLDIRWCEGEDFKDFSIIR